MAGPAQGIVYAASQAARVGWFFGQYALAARITGPTVPAEALPAGPWPGVGEVLADLRVLLETDWANIRAGLYPAPADMVPDPRRMLADAARFFRDLPRVQARRRDRGNAEVVREPVPGTERLPRYFRQNFHYQTGGYLTAESARLYDHQVEVLFGGGADAMRRRALVPLASFFRDRPVRGARLLDVGTGTGRFLSAVKQAYPALETVGLDLSLPYLGEARTRLADRRGVGLVQGPGERLPFADGTFDAVTTVFLLHELPRKVRQAAAAEMARVLKPGGMLVVVDSLQTGDRPRYDALLRLFPLAFHEPYYADYTAQDLATLFTPAGLVPEGPADLAFISKVTVWRRG
ncbi:MAG: hypothetical protein RLY86_3923 [Pseudomonadota bacterium]|jgi:ubiquinone/menaquinone biosynthesis C-methylase UbiE